MALALPSRVDRVKRELVAARPTSACFVLENAGFRAAEKRWGDGPPIRTAHEDLAHAFCVACEALRHVEGRVLFVEDDCEFDEDFRTRPSRVRKDVSDALSMWDAPVLYLGCIPTIVTRACDKGLVVRQALGAHAVVLTAEARRRLTRALRAPPKEARTKTWIRRELLRQTPRALVKRDLDVAINALFRSRLALARWRTRASQRPRTRGAGVTAEKSRETWRGP